MSEPVPVQSMAIFSLLPKAVSHLPLPVRYRAENALEGFARAKTLLPLDREIASFRAITAAEEAASALIRSLQLRKYPASNLIDLKNHSHKAAVPFFLRAVRQELAGDGTVEMQITLSCDPPKITIALPLRQFVSVPENMSNFYLELSEPLGFVGNKPNFEGKAFFDEAVQKVAGSRKVDKLIASEANSRNRILYAHDGGLPKSQATRESIDARRVEGMLCLILSIAVLQVEHQQHFASQCLAGFLKVIKRTDALPL